MSICVCLYFAHKFISVVRYWKFSVHQQSFPKLKEWDSCGHSQCCLYTLYPHSKRSQDLLVISSFSSVVSSNFLPIFYLMTQIHSRKICILLQECSIMHMRTGSHKILTVQDG